MGASVEINSFPKTFPSCKVTTVESNLQQTLTIFKELVIEFEELHSENQSYRSLYLMHKKNSESQTCKKCEELRKNITIKEEILDSVVSALNKLSRTRDFNTIDTIFKLINGDKDILISPKDNICEDEVNDSVASPLKEGMINDVTHEESMSEIEGTPGRKSPIIQSKKLKSNTTHSLSLKDKKKCPESWPTPEKKSLKLSFPTPTRNKPSGRLKQARLNLVKMKTSSVVDLTCSPEQGRSYSEVNIQCNIKKEVLENDDTILPSPTSGPVVQLPIFKSIIKESPRKIIKPSPVSKTKMEDELNNRDTENEGEVVKKEVDDSINLLKQYPNRFKSPLKMENKPNDETHCADESISLLQHVKKIDEKIKRVNSPNKRPLIENVNFVNTQKLADTQSSVSILQQDTGHIEAKTVISKRMKNIEPVYKEPILRKKAEKRALPGWSCEECKNFYDELYKDDYDMLAKKMDECSKHRGRNNPIRPKTPDGFWNPRWDVPQDTEEFNLRNNAM